MGGQCRSKLLCCAKPIPANEVHNNVASLGRGNHNAAFSGDTGNRYVETSFQSTSPQDMAIANSGPIYVVLYDFNAIQDGDLSLLKGERLLLLNDEPRNWWLFKSLRNGFTGYAPINYIVPSENHLQQKSWYVGNIPRSEARRRLLRQSNEAGTFLIRDSESYPGNYSLSILIDDKKTGKNVVHYRISKTADEKFVMKPDTVTFNDLEEFVAHYSNNNNEFKIKLGNPCSVRETPLPQSLERDTFEIAESSLKHGKEIGRGKFSKVYEGFWGRTKVSVKIIADNKMSRDDVLREAEIMKSLHHDNIVRLWGVITETRIQIVTEYMENGSLKNFLLKDGGRNNLDSVNHQRREMSIQIAAGMSYLENRNFIHRDLRAANVLVGKDDKYKIADFGLARFITDDEYLASGDTFPVKWTAVEALLEKRFSIKSDVWSYGILLYEIFSRGGDPYPGRKSDDIADLLITGYRSPPPRGCPENVYTIMKKCWEETPSARPSFGDLQETFEGLLDENPYDVGVEPEN